MTFILALCYRMKKRMGNSNFESLIVLSSIVCLIVFFTQDSHDDDI